MFQFTGLTSRKRDDMPPACRVVPFGNPRINGCLHLPEAYRSLSRPSSSPRAKASAVRPYLLSAAIYAAASSRLYLLFQNVNEPAALRGLPPKLVSVSRTKNGGYPK